MKIKLLATIIVIVSLIWISAPANSAGSRQIITAENASQLQELYLLGQGTVNDITWSPDGKTFIVSTTRGVWLYDTANVNLPPFRLVTHSTAEVVFSADGSLLAAYNTYGPISIWNIKTHTLVRRITIPDQDTPFEHNRLYNVTFKPSGKLLMTLGNQGSNGFSILDEETGKTIINDKDTYQIDDVTVAPDLKTVAIASGDLTGPDYVEVWNLATGKSIVKMEGFQSKTNNVVFSADSSLIATANGNVPSDFAGQDDNVVALWDGKTHAKLAVLNGHTSWVTRVAISPHGKVVASGSADGTVRLWDVQTHQLRQTINTDRGIVTTLAFSPDGTLLAEASGGGDIRLWSLADWKLQAVIDGFTGDSNPYLGPGSWSNSCCLAFSPDSKQVAFGQYNSLIQVWNTATGKTTRILHGHKDVVSSVGFSADNKAMVSSGLDGSVRLWNIKAGFLSQTLDLKGQDDFVPVYLVQVSPDGNFMAFYMGGNGSGFKIYKMNSLVKLHEEEISYRSAFSPDSGFLAIVGYQSIIVWDLKNNNMAATLPFSYTADPVNEIRFSQDSKELVIGTGEGNIVIWNVATKQIIKQFNIRPITDSGNYIWFDNALTRAVITNSSDHDTDYIFHINIWDIQTEKRVAQIDSHHSPTSVDFSPDDELLALGGRDYGAEVWDPATGKQLAWLHYPDDEQQSFQFQYVEFSPDGTLIGIVGGEDAVTLYGVPAVSR